MTRPVSVRSALAWWSLACVAFAPFALAHEESSASATLPITLEQCIHMAEKNSLAQRIAEIDVQIAKAQMGQELGTFDTVLFLSHQFERDINPSASSLEGGFGNVQVIGIETESTTLQGGFRGTLLNGASYQADINWSKRLQSPAPFSLINPTYRADVGVTFTQPLLRGFGSAVTKAALLQARNFMRSSADALEEQRLLQARDVVVAYWNYFFARRTLETRVFNVEQAERLLSINRTRK
jgi:outer membrane protein TolC